MDQAKRPEDWTRRQDRLLLHSLVDIGGDFLRRYPWYMGLATGLLLLSGLAEGIGILTLLPVLDLLLGQEGPISQISQVYQQIFDAVGLPMTLVTALILVVLLIWAKAIFLFGAQLYGANLQAAINRDFRLDMLRALMQARWQFFTGEPVGRLTNIILQEAEYAATASRALMMIASNTIQLLVYLITALLISWKLTISAIVAGVIIILMLRVFIEMTRRQGVRATELNRAYSSRIVELLHSLKPLKAMALEERVAPFLERETEQIMTTQRRLNLATVAISQLQEPIAGVFIAIGILVAVQTLGIETTSLLVMVALFARTVGRISGQLKAFRKLARVEAPYYAFTGKQQAIEAEVERASTEGQGTAGPALHFDESLVVESVGFSYDKKPVLSELSLSVRSGELVSIIGPSGSGKSTLLDLLSGLLQPDSGRILIDGIDLAKLDRLAWRRLIGYVPQETTLFHATILQNITLGDPNIDEATVVEALKDAGAWDFVSNMEGGLQAMAGERGLKVSGGQRQRLAIARALVRRPRLLLLDEATSALDGRTEREFCETLQRLVPQVTIVAISHRPAISEIADRCYHLVEGRLAEPESGAPALEPRLSATIVGPDAAQ